MNVEYHQIGFIIYINKQLIKITHLPRVNFTSACDSKRFKGPSTVRIVFLLDTACSVFKEITAGFFIHGSIFFLVTSKKKMLIMSNMIQKSDNKDDKELKICKDKLSSSFHSYQVYLIAQGCCMIHNWY